MSKQQHSITTLPPSPDEEHRARVVKYSVTMGIRTVCVILALFLHGWWQAAAIAGAVVLPYFAVMVANIKKQSGGAAVERPGAIVRSRDARE
jgi:hypothetical protein